MDLASLFAALQGGVETGALTGFVVASVVMEITPGPNMAYLAILALGDGRRAGYAAVLGVALGLLIAGLAASLGLGAAIASSPLAWQILRWGGVLYLLWLAWDGWRDGRGTVEHAARGSSLGRFFRRGLFVNLLNPKAFAFYIAVLPGFIVPGANITGQAVGLSLIYVAIATIIHAAIVTGAAASHRALRDPARQRRIRRVLSVLLAFVALWLAVRTAG